MALAGVKMRAEKLALMFQAASCANSPALPCECSVGRRTLVPSSQLAGRSIGAALKFGKSEIRLDTSPKSGFNPIIPQTVPRRSM